MFSFPVFLILRRILSINRAKFRPKRDNDRLKEPLWGNPGFRPEKQKRPPGNGPRSVLQIGQPGRGSCHFSETIRQSDKAGIFASSAFRRGMGIV